MTTTKTKTATVERWKNHEEKRKVPNHTYTSMMIERVWHRVKRKKEPTCMTVNRQRFSSPLSRSLVRNCCAAIECGMEVPKFEGKANEKKQKNSITKNKRKRKAHRN